MHFTQGEKPLFIIEIDIGKDKKAQLNIFEDSDPDKLAVLFLKNHGLPQIYKEKIKETIDF